ncbi:ParA family protein [Aliikangiella coralliicola]|uniref:ParA family protein n=1 Tax=Aliikangiella coralliicola TaxID=2592383 RepID=A0A545UH46_9GAMM|nr:ParA family protein [Aliikangiella coralliicola]TQV88794.1 ParA family protein [Aliikangiella coralliicola]
MRRIAFWSPKGGVGKTTLALNFAGAAYYAGYKVLVCDLDPQQSSIDVFNEKKLPFSVVPDKPQVMPNVDFLIYDHAPDINTIPSVETIIMPMRASVLDLKAINRCYRLVRDKTVIKCINAVDTRRHDERILAMKLFSEGAHLVKDRSIYVRSLSHGETVFQMNVYGARDAQNELNRLLSRVLSIGKEKVVNY